MPVVLDPTIVASELVVLDPVEVADDRTELNLNSGDIVVKADGIDWGDAEIQAYMADQARGSSPVDIRFPNRNITIPLVLKADDTVGFRLAQSSLQAKVGLIQREGGWLKRGEGLYADVVNATLHMPETWLQFHRDANVDVVLTLETLPDWYGDEVTLSDHSTTTAGELVWTETDVLGDYPGRLRLVVDNDESADQLGLIAAVRSRHYDSATSAKLVYTADELTALDAAAGATVGGLAVVRHQNLGTGWTPVLSTQATGGGAHKTHTGSYRVRARVYTTSTTDVEVRWLWDVGDFTNPVENAAVTIPGSSNFYLVDLGEVRLDPTTGTHRWQGVLQAKGTSGGENVSVRKLYFEPLDEGWAKLVAPVNSDIGLAGYSARDEFNQSAGALSGKTAAIGGTWAGTGSSDFAVEATGHTAQRTAVSDSFAAGRFTVVGSSTFAKVAVGIDFKSTEPNNVNYRGALARYTDANNWLFAGPRTSAGFQVLKRVAGSVTVLGDVNIAPFLAADTWYSVRLFVDAAGLWTVWLYTPGGGIGQPFAAGQDSDLATGGTLASGKVGFYDERQDSDAATRSYDNFQAWVPTSDAVLFASQSAEVRWDGHFREDSAGAAYGPVSNVEGDLLRIPPSGLEGRTVQFMVKGSRGDFDQIPDSATGDDISARVSYRPSWLFVPSS